MFFGNYAHSLDVKGRLVIPARFKIAPNETLYALKGQEKCLSIFQEADFLTLQAKISRLDFNKKDNRDYIRIMQSSIIELVVDSHGRILIPVKTQNDYKLTKNIMVIGVNDHFEIWDKDEWTKYEEDVSGELENISERIANHE